MTSPLTHIELVSLTDPEFRAWRKQHAMQSLTYGRSSRRSDYEALTYLTEELVRALLPRTGDVISRRLLKYRQGNLPRYRELDAVVLDEESSEPSMFIEIKTSVRRGLTRAANQLRGSLAIARRRWSHLSGVAIWVDTSCLCDEPPEHPEHLPPCTSVEESLTAIESISGASSLALRLDLDELLSRGEALGLLPEPLPTLRASAARSLAQCRSARSTRHMDPIHYEDEGFASRGSAFQELSQRRLTGAT